MKSMQKLIKGMLIGMVLIAITLVKSYSQHIDETYWYNLNEAKENNGMLKVNKSEVKANLSMIEGFYNTYEKHEHLSWSELLEDKSFRSVQKLATVYKKDEMHQQDLAIAKQHLEQLQEPVDKTLLSDK